MRALKRFGAEGIALLGAAVVFLVPFSFMLLTAVKDPLQSADLDFSWPNEWRAVQNLLEVIEARDYVLLRAYLNSTILTVVSVTLIVLFAAMAAFVLQRRAGRIGSLANFLVLAGLIIPPAIVPTIWLLQAIGLFKTLPGLILIEVAFHLSFAVLLFRAFVAAIPRELDEAAQIDGCTGLALFFRVIFPLLRPVTVTVIVTSSVAVFNDFVNPLYFLPGDDNATVQVTLYNFQSQYSTQWNLLFMDIVLITIPPLLLFIFFNRKIVAGMTAGAIKG
ncbi:carbohydrate ABC transporter permease [Nonomuraea angiospora]|uniref:Raffinose/stachyose/melibiose transport system permease protein n=1 Tax=Nonomuraea angiospora TaxID=46172 RepID=A0ABR9M767_9ACTN|nr:carbohydrate ABC transporter permease [Nonomuraea angiospora]MBE1588372.1 raffinose/stachyose/melibiose transport system permease protein [Nonomuraea angiospora]MDX3107079.1 carbohydrate ABC transporter permease [Nonomuraea angiospora]